MRVTVLRDGEVLPVFHLHQVDCWTLAARSIFLMLVFRALAAFCISVGVILVDFVSVKPARAS
jgi:hypothetical protein